MKRCEVKYCRGKYHGKGLCKKHYERKQRLLNPDRNREATRKYRLKHRKEINEMIKLWQKNHPIKYKRMMRKYYLKNRERLDEKRRLLKLKKRNFERNIHPDILLEMMRRKGSSKNFEITAGSEILIEETEKALEKKVIKN